MKVSVEVKGVAEVLSDLRDRSRKLRDVRKRLLPAVAGRIVTQAKALAPRYAESGGALPDSIHATEPIEQRTSTSESTSVTVVAGGAAAPWALEAHEDFTAKHRHGGPKYLERPAEQELAALHTALEGEGTEA